MRIMIKKAMYAGMGSFILLASSASARGVGKSAAFDQLSLAAEEISSVDLNNDPSRASAALSELYSGRGNSGDIFPAYADSRPVAGNSGSEALSRADNLYKSIGMHHDPEMVGTNSAPPEPKSAVHESSAPESGSGAAAAAAARKTSSSSGDTGGSFLLCPILLIVLLLILL